MNDATCILVSLFGDVMTGRGVDQILPHPGRPTLHEPWVRDARDYVRLAEDANGPIPRPVGFDYIWGDLPAELHRLHSDLIIANLETAITTSDAHWPGKEVHYRMHPRNVACLTAARIDCCCLANNHVLDWGYDGLAETLRTLDGAHLPRVGAGGSEGEARGGARCMAGEGRGGVVVVAAGSTTSGIPSKWAAAATRAGVHLVDLSGPAAQEIAAEVRRLKHPGDVSVVSIHWGGNWGHDVPAEQVEFAHELIDQGVDIIHGHSSHHVKAIEIYRNRPILYGSGDLINDYEGIPGHDSYRPDIRMVITTRLARNGSGLQEMRITPLVVRRMRLTLAPDGDAHWLCDLLSQHGTRPERDADGSIRL